MEQTLLLEGKKTARRLYQKLEVLKEEAIQEILNRENSTLQNFKEVLKENLYNNTILRMKEKSIIIKIIQKDKFNEEDKEKLISILSKLPTEDLISLLGEDVKNQIKTFIKQKQNGIMESDHYNRWLTDNIYAYLKRLEGEIRILFEPFIEFKNMGVLFGLYKNYIPTNRMYKNSKKIIAKSTLDESVLISKKLSKIG